MEMQEKIRKTREQIWNAIHDYGLHTEQTAILKDISAEFVDRLAEDSVKAKQPLREMFRKSPAWDENLDALVINGTRTHEPNYTRVDELAHSILRSAKTSANYLDVKFAINFFSAPDADEENRKVFLDALKRLAPKAYAPGKKLSRVFKALCKELGVVDETAGSEFQFLYAQLADELSAKKINFKLFVSLNPAHFLTMSNPKNDTRGETLTSCHSLNSRQYEFNNGCSGYARDGVTMIAFTAADPSAPETLNNRKTTRQLFMYKPGGGLLLQSRMYNTSGGTYGAQAESALYRKLVQFEISECEGVPNLWNLPIPYFGQDDIILPAADGFGGYRDWEYDNFDAQISIRKDHVDDFGLFQIGAPGLCISCGAEHSHGLYCDEECVKSNDDDECCAECGDYIENDDGYWVHNSNGNEIYVCRDCRDNYYTYCDHCNEYYPNEDVRYLEGADEYVCDECRDNDFETCDCCGEYYRSDDMYGAVDCNGAEVRICDGCRIDCYTSCNDCGTNVHDDDLYHVYRDGKECWVCPNCKSQYVECDECGEYHHETDIEDGLCPECFAEAKEEELA